MSGGSMDYVYTGKGTPDKIQLEFTVSNEMVFDDTAALLSLIENNVADELEKYRASRDDYPVRRLNAEPLVGANGSLALFTIVLAKEED